MTSHSSSHQAYNWVRDTPLELKNLDSIPLTGNAPAFAWEEFSNRLATTFDREGLTVQPGETKWRTEADLYEGLGDDPVPLIFSISPLQGQICWVLPRQEIFNLMGLLLTKESHPLPIHDAALSESFYQFLALEVLYHFTEISLDKTLTPILTHQTALPSQASLCRDFSLNIQNQTIWGRLLIAPEFRRSWVEHFALQNQTTHYSQQIAELTETILHLEIGKIFLSLMEWKTVQAGDFILLDQCSLNNETLEGRIALTVNGKQAFRAKLKDKTLKILELPLLHEVHNPMAKQSNDHDDFSDLDLPEEDSELFEDDLEDDLSDHTIDEDDLLEDSTDSQEEEKADQSNTEVKPKAHSISPTDAHPQSIKLENIPLTLTVEIGQVQITLDKLLKLEPGNLLEIDIHPENGVDLTVNGKVIGKGELIRLGEALGIRILQVGQ